jgi:hypothetical protein
MGETAKFTSHMSWTTTAFLWGKLTFSCNEYTCLMSAKHQSSTQYQDWYILYIVMGEITKFTSHVSWVTLCEKNHIIVVISDIETGKKLLLLWVLTLLVLVQGLLIASDHTSLVVSLILISIPRASLHTQTNTGHNMQTADWLRNHCDPQCSVAYLEMQGLFWSYFKYQKCMCHTFQQIMIGNKQLPCIMPSTLQPVKGFVVVCRFSGFLPVSHLLVL